MFAARGAGAFAVGRTTGCAVATGLIVGAAFGIVTCVLWGLI